MVKYTKNQHKKLFISQLIVFEARKGAGNPLEPFLFDGSKPEKWGVKERTGVVSLKAMPSGCYSANG